MPKGLRHASNEANFVSPHLAQLSATISIKKNGGHE